MKVAVIYNKNQDYEGVINVFGMQNQETYNPRTVERVASSLEKGGHNVRIIDGNINVIEQLESFMPRVVQGEQPGMVFNMAYGIQGVSRYTHIPSLLEMLGVPYVGSSPAGHGIALDKVTTKVLIQAAGLPTAPYWVFYSPDMIPDGLPYPVITKPKMEAVSLGIEVVHNKPDLQKLIRKLFDEFHQPILVEQFIPGREFAVGLLGNQDPEILPILEIDLQGDPNAIQSLHDKLRQPKQKICPAPVSESLAQELRRLTRETFRTLGIYDFCRVDFRMDDRENLYILELNSMASLGATGSYVAAAEKAGYTFESLINRMLDVAVERYFGKQYLEQIGQEEPVLQNLIKKTTTPLRVRLRNFLRGNLTTMEEMLYKMVEINSYVRNIEGVNAMGTWVSNRLAQLGFQREVLPKAEFGNMLYFTNHGEEQNDVLLIGQLDNPVSFQDFVPLTVERGKIYGTGVSRGKGGLALLLGALQALRYTRSLKKVRVGILLVTDESLGGRSSKTLVHDFSSRSKYVLGLRGAGLQGQLLTSFSGSMNYQVELNQANKDPKNREDNSTDIVTFLSNRIAALKNLASPDSGLTVRVTSVETKGTEDQEPHYALMTLLIRFRYPDQKDMIDQQVNKILETSPKSPIRVHVSRGSHRKPLLETEFNLDLYRKVKHLSDVLEVRVEKIHSESSSVLCNCHPDVPAVDGLGPVTGGSGTKNEYIVRDSLIDRAVLLAYTLFQASKDFSK